MDNAHTIRYSHSIHDTCVHCSICIYIHTHSRSLSLSFTHTHALTGINVDANKSVVICNRKFSTAVPNKTKHIYTCSMRRLFPNWNLFFSFTFAETHLFICAAVTVAAAAAADAAIHFLIFIRINCYIKSIDWI